MDQGLPEQYQNTSNKEGSSNYCRVNQGTSPILPTMASPSLTALPNKTLGPGSIPLSGAQPPNLRGVFDKQLVNSLWALPAPASALPTPGFEPLCFGTQVNPGEVLQLQLLQILNGIILQ
jgi:hypothetical protein